MSFLTVFLHKINNRQIHVLLNVRISDTYLSSQILFRELIKAIKVEKFMDATEVKLFEVLLGDFKPDSSNSTLLDEVFHPHSITCQGYCYTS